MKKVRKRSSATLSVPPIWGLFSMKSLNSIWKFLNGSGRGVTLISYEVVYMYMYIVVPLYTGVVSSWLFQVAAVFLVVRPSVPGVGVGREGPLSPDAWAVLPLGWCWTDVFSASRPPPAPAPVVLRGSVCLVGPPPGPSL